MSEGKHSTAEMIAEALREAGILVVVFVPIEAIFSFSDHELGKVVSLEILAIGVITLGLGIFVERVRR